MGMILELCSCFLISAWQDGMFPERCGHRLLYIHLYRDSEDAERSMSSVMKHSAHD